MSSSDITPDQAEQIANSWRIDAMKMAKENNELMHRIKELEAGQGEPVGYWVVEKTDGSVPYPGSGFSHSKPEDIANFQSVTPLFSIPPTINAAVAAALMKAEKVSKRYAENDDLMAFEGIRSLPRDESALVEFGMKVGEAVWSAFCGTSPAKMGQVSSVRPVPDVTKTHINGIVQRVLKGEE